MVLCCFIYNEAIEQQSKVCETFQNLGLTYMGKITEIAASKICPSGRKGLTSECLIGVQVPAPLLISYHLLAEQITSHF